tara:strand:+ start:3074 stop:3781 length:708 start_codon:yes stop_codon:yes gene_type:complete
MSEDTNNKKSGELTIKLSKDDLWKYSTFLLIAVVVIGGFIAFSGEGDTNANVVNNPPSEQPAVVKATIDDDAVLGDPDAPVTIIEFSDYQCPFCARFWSQTLPQLKSEYIDTGKVKLVFRDFPLTSIHPLAMSASEATECVREQGGDDAFWDMHDQIFGNYQEISLANLKSWAQDMGYDIGSCLDDGDFKAEVQKDLKDATAAGGRGTPYFVVNGKALSGAQPFSAFQQAIEAEL